MRLRPTQVYTSVLCTPAPLGLLTQPTLNHTGEPLWLAAKASVQFGTIGNVSLDMGWPGAVCVSPSPSNSLFYNKIRGIGVGLSVQWYSRRRGWPEKRL